MKSRRSVLAPMFVLDRAATGESVWGTTPARTVDPPGECTGGRIAVIGGRAGC
jgi:hypothetical protein